MPRGETRHNRRAKSGAKLPADERATSARSAALASEASGQRGKPSKVRAHSASEDARKRADGTRPEPGSSARASRSAAERVAAPPRRSAAMQLAAEVERLERELADARTRMAELEARAEIDPLTDILNRRGFERALKRSLDHAKRYESSAALIYLDLDDFKSVNDRHGHAAGDAVLKAVAAVLMRHVRASDVVARLGGDEFAVLLWQLSEADVERKARALEAVVARTTAVHAGLRLSVGASAGAALLLPLDRPADVLERADQAMYQRKRARLRSQ